VPDLILIERILTIEFSEIIEATEIIHNKLRIFLKEESFVDIWFSSRIKGRYSHHWDRRKIDNTFYRHDNMPHKKWETVKTFPKHFHNGSSKDKDVKESFLNDEPVTSVREFFKFIKERIKTP